MNHAHRHIRGSLLGAGLGARLAVAGSAIAVLWLTVRWALA
jgi:hypothetical protein